jgi:hypothetical protein
MDAFAGFPEHGYLTVGIFPVLFIHIIHVFHIDKDSKRYAYFQKLFPG